MVHEAVRVSNQFIIIKDHICENKYQRFILKCMDWFGNKPDFVGIPANYCSKKQWEKYFSLEKVHIIFWSSNISLYSFPLNILFRPNLHCFIVLEKIN